MLPYISGKCTLTSNYGYRTHPITGVPNSPHWGIDLVGMTTPNGDKHLIRAVCGGTVAQSRMVRKENDKTQTWQWGEYIAISGTDGYTIYYCHLSQRLVKVGDKVIAGQIIGVEGRTGQATGVHLHFEVRKGSQYVNAASYLGIKNEGGIYTDNDPIKETVVKEQVPKADVFKKNDKIKIKQGAFYKGNKTEVPAVYIGKIFTVSNAVDGYVLVKELYSWVSVDYITKV